MVVMLNLSGMISNAEAAIADVYSRLQQSTVGLS